MNAKTIKLALMPYAQARINVYPLSATRVLVSYRTPVAELTDDGWLYVNGIYSRTTGRHITAFIKEYAPNIATPFQTAKWLATERLAMNINTGEIKKVV